MNQKELFISGFATENSYSQILRDALINRGYKVHYSNEKFNADLAFSLGVGLVNFHWVNIHIEEADFENTFSRFRQQVNRLRDANIKVVWTVHNLVPHAWANEFLWEKVNVFLCQSSDLILVMGGEEEDYLRALMNGASINIKVLKHWLYPLPKRRTNNMSRSVRQILCFGQIKSYKGVEELCQAFTSLDLPATKLKVVGSCSDQNLKARLVKIKSEAIDFDFRFLSESEIVDLLHESDAAVFNFKKITNSGSVIFALSAGVPVVAPLLGNIRDLSGYKVGEFFETDVRIAILRLLNENPEVYEEGLSNFAIDYSNDKTAEKLCAELDVIWRSPR